MPKVDHSPNPVAAALEDVLSTTEPMSPDQGQGTAADGLFAIARALNNIAHAINAASMDSKTFQDVASGLSEVASAIEAGNSHE
jgi:hypothetical protein